jgi:hypothetical protein
LEIKFGFAVLAVRGVDEKSQVRGIDFGGRELQDDLLTVWEEKTEFLGFSVRGTLERIGNHFFFVLHDFDFYGIRRGAHSVANVPIDAKGQGFAGQVLDRALSAIVRSFAAIIRHLQKWGFEPRLRRAVSLFEIRNQSSVLGEEIGMEASHASSEKIGVADGIFRGRDVVGADGNREGKGKKHSAECGPSLEHCLARMKDVLFRQTVTARSKSQPSKLPHGGMTSGGKGLCYRYGFES